MPNDTIERGIKKASGDNDSVTYKYVTYEGYGPNGIAIIVDALTDNSNRTAANVRSAFTKGQGNIGTPGCVSFMFDKRGLIIVDKEECDIYGPGCFGSRIGRVERRRCRNGVVGSDDDSAELGGTDRRDGC